MHPALQKLADDIVKARTEPREYEGVLRWTGLEVRYRGWRLAGVIGMDGTPVEGDRATPFKSIEEAGRWFDKRKEK